MDSQLVVLGGGPGGYAAAFLAADLACRSPWWIGTAAGRHLPAARLHPLEGPAARRQGDGGRPAPGRMGRMFAKPASTGAMRARKEKVIATLTGGFKQIASKSNTFLHHW